MFGYQNLVKNIDLVLKLDKLWFEVKKSLNTLRGNMYSWTFHQIVFSFLL